MIHSIFSFPLSPFSHVNFLLHFPSFTEHYLKLSQCVTIDWPGIQDSCQMVWETAYLFLLLLLHTALCHKETCLILLNPAFSKIIYSHISTFFKELSVILESTFRKNGYGNDIFFYILKCNQ